MPRHVDIPRLRQGKVGGFFWLALSPDGHTPHSYTRRNLGQYMYLVQTLKTKERIS